MKDLTITSVIKVYEYDELNDTDRALLDDAIEATRRSYAPYSHFSVGAAALLANGVVVTGTNQENAAYPSGLCAERTTLFYANSQYPDQAVVTLAIAARTEKDFIDTPIPPCGACRQVILETEKRYATPSLRKRGLTFVSTTGAMSVRAWSFFPPSTRAQPSGPWRRKAYAPRKASSTAGSKPPMPLSVTSRRKSLSCLIGLPKQKQSLPSHRHPTLFLC